jgi:SHS2 domain-containing protein
MYHWRDLGGELELTVESGSEEGVLHESTGALTELLGAGASTAGGEIVTRDVTVEADDRATLLHAWLEELVFLADAEGFVAEAVRFDAIDEHGLRAQVTARQGEPARAVKAVTYHRLAFDRAGESWRASVVFEV